MEALWSADTDDFLELVNASGLDRARDFVGADLRNMDFSDMELEGFDFTRADFRGSNLLGTSFTHCKLAGAQFDGARPLDLAALREIDPEELNDLLVEASASPLAGNRMSALRKFDSDANSKRYFKLISYGAGDRRKIPTGVRHAPGAFYATTELIEADRKRIDRPIQ